MLLLITHHTHASENDADSTFVAIRLVVIAAQLLPPLVEENGTPRPSLRETGVERSTSKRKLDRDSFGLRITITIC